MLIFYAGGWQYFRGFPRPVKLDLRLVRRLDLLLKACRQCNWYSELKCPKTFLKYFIMPDTIISLIVTHNSIKGLPTQIAMCCLIPAWQGYSMELVPNNKADKARCHPCQHALYIWGNLGTRWLKEILLLPNTDWQQKCFAAVFFSVLTTVTASAIFVREANEKEQDIDCCSPSCRIPKGTVQWGMRRKPQGREIRERRGGTRAFEIHSTSPPMGVWKKVSECWSFLMRLSVRKVWLSVWVLQRESTPSQQACVSTSPFSWIETGLPAGRTRLNRDSTAMAALGRRHQSMLVVGRGRGTLLALVRSNLPSLRTWPNRSHLCNTSGEAFWWSPIAGAVCRAHCQKQKCCLGKET